MHLQITNIWLVRIRALYLRTETSGLDTYNNIYYYETEKRLNGDLKPDQKKATKGPQWAQPQTLVVRLQPSETYWRWSRYLWSEDRLIAV